MSTRDLAHNLVPQHVASFAIDDNVTFHSTSIDTSDYDGGYMFYCHLWRRITGTFTVQLEESPNNSDWTTIPSEKRITPDGTTVYGAVGSGKVRRMGAFSHQKWVRAAITGDGVTPGSGCSLHGFFIKNPEGNPHLV
jgi:hypothetical protein